MKHSISVVVPVYNSEASLRELINRLQPVLYSIAEKCEVILVNDASLDNSWKIIQQIASQITWVRGVSLMRNYGQHNAILCGVREARYDLIVTLDDDLQHPPEEIPRLIAALDEGYDVVYGTPEKQQHGLLRDLASQITKFGLRHAMGARTARQVSAFRAFRTSLREAFAAYRGPYVALDVLLTWGTRNFSAVRVRHDSRKHGRSSYTLTKLVLAALNLTTGFTTVPLHFASIMGFVFTLFGFSVLAFVLFQYVMHGRGVPGFPFLASIIAMFSGAQLFALGIIGEYIARMHFRTMDRPPYVVRKTTEQPDSNG
jgi:glycosyltransferase involved in cell wall biosynthesis